MDERFSGEICRAAGDTELIDSLEKAFKPLEQRKQSIVRCFSI